MFNDSPINRLEHLPQRPDVTWQGGLIHLPGWVENEEGKPCRPYAAIWVAAESGLVAPPQLCLDESEASTAVLDGLIVFATDGPLGGYRPGRVEVKQEALATFLSHALAGTGIDVAQRDSVPAFDRVAGDFVEHITDEPPAPGALEGKGVTIDRMRAFAEAAKQFYEAAPWQHLTDEDLLRVRSPKPPAGMGCVAVLGAGGQTFGLGFFSSQKAYWGLRTADDPASLFDQRKTDTWSLTFDGVTDIPLADSELWLEHHLPLADKQAYPCAVCYRKNGDVARPDAKTLAYLEGLLRALTMSGENQIDTGRWEVTVSIDEGTKTYRLSLPDLIDPPNLDQRIERGFMPDRRGSEQTLAQMQRYVAQHQVADMDEMNRLLERFRKHPDEVDAPPRNPLEEAQELCYEAFDSFGRRQLQLARKALEVCPDAADAYVIFAEREPDPQRARDLYEAGLTRAESALGKQRVVDDAEHFWGMLDTRPYMRCLFGLAQTLEGLDECGQAIDRYEQLLHLNPGDNQGARYLLLPLLLETGEDGRAARLLKAYDDESSANWAYARALLAYRLSGNSVSARKELQKANKINPYVIELMTQKEEPPFLPPHYSPGSVEEAAICVHELREPYNTTPGAVDWLREFVSDDHRGGRSPHVRRREPKRRKRKSR